MDHIHLYTAQPKKIIFICHIFLMKERVHDLKLGWIEPLHLGIQKIKANIYSKYST